MGDEKGWTANLNNADPPFWHIHVPFLCRRLPVDSRLSHRASASVIAGGERASCPRVGHVRRRGLFPHATAPAQHLASTFPRPSLNSPGAHAVSVRSKKFPKDDPGLSPTVRTRQDWCLSRRRLGLSACIDAMVPQVGLSGLQGCDEV